METGRTCGMDIPNYGGIIDRGSGHIGFVAIYGEDPELMYIVSGTAEDGIMGPLGDGGVYVTTNGGQNWEPRDYGLPYGVISAFYFNQTNPEDLLVGLTGGGIYKTTDGGKYWFKTGDFTSVVDFQPDGNVMLAGTAKGVIESTDGGYTWNLISLTEYPVASLSVSGSVAYAWLWGPGTGEPGAVYLYFEKSVNLEKNWTRLHTFEGNYPIFISASPYNSSNVYFGFANATLPVST
ncbi:MAG: WD40/YVTN/BNR-like repeat-containing protein [Thermoprotei archaeon]